MYGGGYRLRSDQAEIVQGFPGYLAHPPLKLLVSIPRFELGPLGSRPTTLPDYAIRR